MIVKTFYNSGDPDPSYYIFIGSTYLYISFYVDSVIYKAFRNKIYQDIKYELYKI